MKIELLGWASSLVLLLTIATQIRKQWRDGTSAGVSAWLFVGQVAASAGFAVYSYLIRNWIFVATNALMTAAAVFGLALVVKQQWRGPNEARPAS